MVTTSALPRRCRRTPSPAFHLTVDRIDEVDHQVTEPISSATPVLAAPPLMAGESFLDRLLATG